MRKPVEKSSETIKINNYNIMIQIKMGIISIFLSMSFIIILQSCEKKAMTNSETIKTTKSSRGNTSGILITKGVVVFSTLEHFNLKMQELKEMNESQLDNYNQSNINFISLYKQYQIMDELAENGISSSAQEAIDLKLIPHIPDNYFASVVNKNGLLAVEQTIYKYGSDGFQTAPISNLQNIESYNWSSQTILPYAKKLGNSGDQQWASFPPVSKFFEKYNGSNDWPKSNGRPVRAIHTKWCSWFGVYSSAGSKIKMEKKSLLAGWVNIDHSSASNNSSSKFRYFTQFSSSSGSYWDWDYFINSENKITSNQHVNQIVLTYKPSLIAVPLQHQVNNFISTVSITYGGKTLNDTWIH